MRRTSGPDLWLCDGQVATGAAGVRFPLAVARLPEEDGPWVWSPAPRAPDMRAEIDALGPVRHLVAPGSLHHGFLVERARGYRRAQVHAAPGPTDAVAGTSIDTVPGDAPDAAWGGGSDQVVVRGSRITVAAVFFHRPSAAVPMTDLVRRIPRSWYRRWRAVAARPDDRTDTRRAAQVPPRDHR